MAPHSRSQQPSKYDSMSEISLKTSEEDESEEEVYEDTVDEAFTTIMNDFASMMKNNTQFDERIRRAFQDRHEEFLFKKNSDDNTLLHNLIITMKSPEEFNAWKPLAEMLVHNIDVVRTKNRHYQSPLHLAISNRLSSAVALICKNYRGELDQLIAEPGPNNENCLHLAVSCEIPVKSEIWKLLLAPAVSSKDLSERYGGKDPPLNAFCGKDQNGKTPLHLAVEASKCKPDQLIVVQGLINACEEALDVETSSKLLSPYRHHLQTRENGLPRKSSMKNSGDAYEAPGDLYRSSPKHVSIEQGAVEDAEAEVTPDVKKPDLDSGGSADFGLPKHSEPAGYDAALEGDILDEVSGTIKELSLGNRPQSKNTNTRDSSRLKRRPRRKQTATVESANEVRDYLKYHYIRTRIDDHAISRYLYGEVQEKEMFLNLLDHPFVTISPDLLDKLRSVSFESILRFVALPGMSSIHHEEKNAHLSKGMAIKSDFRGRSDVVQIFNYLRHNKGVKQIIQVSVDDFRHPPHSDEAIENSLQTFGVEVWDWRRPDLSIETIRKAAKDVRDVHLYWSGNRAILGGWADQGGLRTLKKLKNVYLHYDLSRGLESVQRGERYVSEFERSLEESIKDDRDAYNPKLQRKIVVKRFDERLPHPHEAVTDGIPPGHTQMETTHQWLDTMDTFADAVQNLRPTITEGLSEEVIKVALIDDGVDFNEPSLDGKFLGGRSYITDPGVGNYTRSWYGSSAGHGTVMACLITRLCPKAKLYVVRLQSSPTRQITAESAAKAVRNAVDNKVHIISMSWTIEKTEQNKDDIEKLKAAVSLAARKGILMFCAASDQGAKHDVSFPAACEDTRKFRVGAAHWSGTALSGVGDQAHIDFLFPGENIAHSRRSPEIMKQLAARAGGHLFGAQTGSSIATAIAAGMAAMILYCVQLAGLHNKKIGRDQEIGAVTLGDFGRMKSHEMMKNAFWNIGTSQHAPKFLEVWNLFENASSKARDSDHDGKLDVISKVAATLVKGTRFSID